MAIMQGPTTHRSWEDWASLILGVLIGLSPGFDQGTAGSYPYVMLNAIVIGFIVVAMAIFELAIVERWDEEVNLVCGLWLAVSPIIFGYSGTGQLRIWHFVLGGLVAAIAALELWQDRNLGHRSG